MAQCGSSERISMRGLRPVRVMVWLALSSPALSQPANAPSDTYKACLQQAIQEKATRKADSDTYFSCYGNAARAWYESLSGDKLVQDKNGLFVARYYGTSGYCAHQIEDANRMPLSAYVCEIVKSDQP
jgi:hypothetical protein